MSVNTLGDRAPYVLWTRGATSLLARPFTDRVTLTGARAATAYGEHIAGSFSSDLALPCRERAWSSRPALGRVP